MIFTTIIIFFLDTILLLGIIQLTDTYNEMIDN